VRHFPFAGAPRDELAPELRVIFHRSYAIYYKPVADMLVIIRVLHGGRDITAIFERGGFTE
jgi:toxin ParE1/3/4